MANTTYLTKTVEPYLLDWVSQKVGIPMEKKRVVVGHNTDGQPASFQFDGVSIDGTVGVCISASCSYKTGQMRKFFMEATLLNRVKSFKRKIMVFIDENIWEGFKNQCDGLVDLKNIEPMFCNELPIAMRNKIRSIYRASASEVGDKSGPGTKIPKRRR